MSLADLTAHVLARRLPPRGDDDPFAREWQQATSLRDMIELIQAGHDIRLYTVDLLRARLAPPRRVTSVLLAIATPDRTYPRAELPIDGGAEAMRRMLPQLAPYALWQEAIEREYAQGDPVANLVHDLERDGRPAERWLARHTIDSAWLASQSTNAMLKLLVLLGAESERLAAIAALGKLGALRPGRSEFAWRAPSAQEEAAAIRSAVPTPPRLPAHRPPVSPAPRRRALEGHEWPEDDDGEMLTDEDIEEIDDAP